MPELPAHIGDDLSKRDGIAVRNWWQRLDGAVQAAIAESWDERRENCLFTPPRDEAGTLQWDSLPVVISGRFVPHDDAFGLREWGPGYFEYLLNNPELLVNRQQEFLMGGICTAHPNARAVLADGVIPAGFACPFADRVCPMRNLLSLAPGQSLQLVGRRVAEHERSEPNDPI